MDVPRSGVGTALVAHFIERWERDDTFMALLRAAATNDAAAKRVRGVLGGQVGPVIAALCVAAVHLGTDLVSRPVTVLSVARLRATGAPDGPGGRNPR